MHITLPIEHCLWLDYLELHHLQQQLNIAVHEKLPMSGRHIFENFAKEVSSVIFLSESCDFLQINAVQNKEIKTVFSLTHASGLFCNQNFGDQIFPDHLIYSLLPLIWEIFQWLGRVDEITFLQSDHDFFIFAFVQSEHIYLNCP